MLILFHIHFFTVHLNNTNSLDLVIFYSIKATSPSAAAKSCKRGVLIAAVCLVIPWWQCVRSCMYNRKWIIHRTGASGWEPLPLLLMKVVPRMFSACLCSSYLQKCCRMPQLAIVINLRVTGKQYNKSWIITCKYMFNYILSFVNPLSSEKIKLK